MNKFHLAITIPMTAQSGISFEPQTPPNDRKYRFILSKGERDSLGWATKAEFTAPDNEWFDLHRYVSGQIDNQYYVSAPPIESMDDLKSEKDFTASSNLFIEFANTPPTADGILSFADRWGLLHWDQSGPIAEHFTPVRLFQIPANDGGFHAVYGEPLIHWIEYIQEMRHQWSIVQHLRERDQTTLNRFLLIRDTPSEEVYVLNMFRMRGSRL